MQNIDINIKPSKVFNALIIIVFFVSILITIYLPIHSKIIVLVCILNVIYTMYIFWTHGLLKSAQSINAIRYLSDRTWLITTAKNHYVGELCGDSTITRWVSVLRFKQPDRWQKQSMVLFRDALAPLQYRQLLVQLRCTTS